MKTLKELLIQFDACSPAIDWAEDKTIEQVVKECHKGEWLLWLAKKLKLPERKLIACAGHCVNTVRHLIKDESSINLLDMCMNFEDESISFEDLKKARQAANANAAHDAAKAASFAAASDFYDDYAAVCAADAAYAAVYDDSVYVAAVARKENELQTANIVRERLGMDIINEVNELLNN